jgi:GNAT superfamily N-acetyltransferase
MFCHAWGKPGDSGVVALADDGEPIGAAWYRTFTADHHAYGFVDESIPEVSIGLARGVREQGIGTLLLTALLAHARDAGLTPLSLAVEQANARAHHIYTKLGFRIVRSSPKDQVMIIDL